MNSIYGIKLMINNNKQIEKILNKEFANTKIMWELYNNNYYIYLKDKKNVKELEKHEKLYLKNSLKRVKSDFLYNLYPAKLEVHYII
jgi:hypothetical protein